MRFLLEFFLLAKHTYPPPTGVIRGLIDPQLLVLSKLPVLLKLLPKRINLGGLLGLPIVLHEVGFRHYVVLPRVSALELVDVSVKLILAADLPAAREVINLLVRIEFPHPSNITT